MIVVAGNDVQNHVGKKMVFYEGQQRVIGKINSVDGSSVEFEQLGGADGGKTFTGEFDVDSPRINIYELSEKVL